MGIPAPASGGRAGKSPRAAGAGSIKSTVAKSGSVRPAAKRSSASASGRGKAAKPVADRARLEARIRKLTAQLAEAKDRIAELEAWADTDSLLDIFNRRGFERELTRAIAYIKRYKASGAVIALDVDRLKPINDTFGHAAGDAVLKAIVHVVLRHVRSSDVVGRLGGDEFAVLLWNLTEADAKAKAAALEDAIDRLTFVFRGHSMSSGASTGVTILIPSDDAQSALERADLAMYARKAERRRALLKL
ncbi:MAG: GGDEF domain-containing protein [Pseudomonadota bacterium]